VRLSEFLAEILTAHGQVLLRLAALLGEEEFLELLEKAEELYPSGDEDIASFEKWEAWLKDRLVPSPGDTPSSAMAEIQSSVTAIQLPEVLEFYVWAYPTYRAYVETGLSLALRIPRQSPTGAPSESGLQLVEDAVRRAQEWFKRLPLPSQVAATAERAAEIPWLRFRSEVLKRVGRRPLGPVY
jgi:hypothetical protein